MRSGSRNGAALFLNAGRAGRAFSCPGANIGSEWEAVDKGVSAADVDKSPRKPQVAGVNGEQEEGSLPWTEKALQAACGMETQRWLLTPQELDSCLLLVSAAILGTSCAFSTATWPPSSALRPKGEMDVIGSNVFCFLPTPASSEF